MLPLLLLCAGVLWRQPAHEDTRRQSGPLGRRPSRRSRRSRPGGPETPLSPLPTRVRTDSASPTLTEPSGPVSTTSIRPPPRFGYTPIPSLGCRRTQRRAEPQDFGGRDFCDTRRGPPGAWERRNPERKATQSAGPWGESFPSVKTLEMSYLLGGCVGMCVMVPPGHLNARASINRLTWCLEKRGAPV